VITSGPARNGAEEHLYKIDPSRNVIVKAVSIPGSGPRCVASPGPQGVWIGCGGVVGITLIDPRSLKPVESVPVDIGEYAGWPIGVPGLTPQIAPGREAVWVLTPAGLVRVDPATARITAIVHIGYDLRAMSVPALTVDRAGRVWIADSLLSVLLPGTLAVHQVTQTAGSRSVAADGRSVWVDTGRTLVELDVPRAAPGHRAVRAG
jgi:DNA-binding beta-propeller fold protein YncE